MTHDITPEIDFGLNSPSPRPATASDIKQAWLAAIPDDATDQLAFIALDLLAERNAFKETLCRSLAGWHESLMKSAAKAAAR